MGAYDNPRILPPPNYAEIFNRNMAQGQAMVKQAFAGYSAKMKEKKKKIQGAEDKFDAMTVKIGSLPKALQDNANMLNEEFFNNEMDLINGNVERADYRNKKNDILKTLNDITKDGGELGNLYKTIDDVKLSRYQRDGYVQTIGLAESVKNRAISFDYTGGNRKITFNNANGDAETIDFIGLDKASLGFNERVDIDNKTLGEIASDVGNLKVTKKLLKSSDGTVDSQIAAQMFEGAVPYLPENLELMTPEQQKEAVQLANAKFRSEQAKGLTNSFNAYMQDEDSRGSLFLDNAYEVLVNQNNSNDFSKNTLKPNADALITAAVDGLELSKEELKTLKEKLRLGVYKLNEGEDPSGKIRQGMDSISKHVLANQAFDAASQNKVLLSDSYQILSPDAIESKRLDLENKRLLNRQRQQQLGDSDAPSEIKPFEDYVKQTYGGTQTGTEGKRIMDFLTDYNALGLNTVTNADQLIEELKTKSSNQLGVQVGGNPYQNYTTVTKLRGELLTNPNAFAARDGKNYRGQKNYIERTEKFLEGRDDNEIVILPTKTDSNGTYFYIGDDSRKQGKDLSFQFISDSNNLNLMVEILKGVEKFKNVDPDVLYKELELYQKDPNRFN